MDNEIGKKHLDRRRLMTTIKLSMKVGIAIRAELLSVYYLKYEIIETLTKAVEEIYYQ